MPNKPAGRGRPVLDTRVWIWAVEGMTTKLGAAAVRAIEEAATASALAVSAIFGVGAAIALDSTQLPDFDHHRDPADRIIIATACRYGTLLTCDESVLAWARAHKHVRALDGRPRSTAAT